MTQRQANRMTTKRRVVVTGMGVISPVGNRVDEMWSSLTAGRSGVRTITRFDTTGFETTFAGEVDNFDPGTSIGKKEARRMDRYTQYAVASALQAREQAELAGSGYDPNR